MGRTQSRWQCTASMTSLALSSWCSAFWHTLPSVPSFACASKCRPHSSTPRTFQKRGGLSKRRPPELIGSAPWNRSSGSTAMLTGCPMNRRRNLRSPWRTPAPLLALVYPRLGAAWFAKAERVLAAVARRRRLSVLLCGFSALAMRLAIFPWVPIPHPYGNDEFSFLLAGDTFAHGRLANPTPPMWVHLETFHVI